MTDHACELQTATSAALKAAWRVDAFWNDPVKWRSNPARGHALEQSLEEAKTLLREICDRHGRQFDDVFKPNTCPICGCTAYPYG